ncbi:DUF4261 domain-containing protein [Bacillus sp. WLY-B-L8]|uniref:DUF4261 domain-containing protein n=1 Tax=Bacillus multifaciens TaxID=3068506 RepID=UPI002741EB72|nr:DUF4261 domain-containing protein [Bacillus sp. WLY-B-L8]MDP7978537.1 DUF4261 domain-containing protein [Bacillus sp. WLY-B-L8]
MAEPQIIIGIPGLWNDRAELVQKVVRKSGGYLLAGNIIHNAKGDIGFEVDIYEHDPSLAEAFLYAGGERLGEDILGEISNHIYTVYVIAKVRNIHTVKEVIDVGMGLLNAGGTAVKIETTGVAYSKEEWKEIADNKEYFLIYSHFVTLVGDENSYYSCGMQSFGLPDVVISAHIDVEEAADLLNDFNLYNLVEMPKLKDGETISFTQTSPVYKLAHCKDYRYERDDLFYNSCGLWELKKV